MQAAWALAVSAIVHVMADVTGALDVTNDLGVRGRSTQGVTPNPSLDLFDTASAQLVLDDRSWALTLGYSASVLDADAELGLPPLVVQAGGLGWRWHDRRLTLGVTEYGSYGQENSATTGALPSPAGIAASPGQEVQTSPPPTPPSVQLLAAPATIRFATSSTVVTATEQLGARESLSMLLEYDLQGGLDTPSQAVLPLVHGPRADAIFTETLSRRNTVDLRLAVQRSDTAQEPCSPFIPRNLLSQPSQACEPAGQIGQAISTWRYRLSRHTDVSAGAGAAVAQVRYQDQQAQFDSAVFPVGAAGVQYSEPLGSTASTVRLDVAAAPFVDLRSGVIDERAQVTGQAVLPARTVVYSGTVGATRSISSRFIEPMTSIQLAVEAEYAASPGVGLGAGARYFWQEQEGLGEFSMAIVFLDVVLRAPRARF